jgi:Ca-activated chloride channel family protein
VESDVEEQQKLRFSVPLSIFPRYDPDAAHAAALPTGPMPRDVGSGSGGGSSSASHVPQDLSVRIHKSAARGEASCLTHSLDRTEEGEYEVYRASGNAANFEEDLVMTIPYGSSQDLTMYVARAGEGAHASDKATVMLSYAPSALLREFDNDATSEVVFVIDCSGSMRGGRMQQAKQTLISCLAGLPEGCLFNIIRFGSTHHSLYPVSREMNDATKAEAMAFTEQMDADLGGTEILAPLRQLMSKPPQLLPRSIFVLTDGGVSNVSDVQDCCRKDHVQHGTK